MHLRRIAAAVFIAAALLSGVASARPIKLALIPVGGSLSAGGGPTLCPVTVGTLTLRASVTRVSGISPLLVFFDATTTSDSATLGGANNSFQDIAYSWNFGDTLASGTGTWAYGSNPAGNSRNVATGAIAAHEYIVPDGTGDQTYTVTVTATDGTSTASCSVGGMIAATAFDPAGANGFPGAATTCVAAASTPVAGSGGCPAGAAVLASTPSFNTALGTPFGTAKRVLFKCGDTFTGDAAALNAHQWSVGAYGACVGTKTGQPTLSESGTNGQLLVTDSATNYDGRISDLTLTGTGTGANNMYGISSPVACIQVACGGIPVTGQITLNNLIVSGECQNISWAAGAQWGVIDSNLGTAGGSCISMFVNEAESNPCGANNYTGVCWTTTPFAQPTYEALIGNTVTGLNITTGSGGVEVIRLSFCQDCVIENNDIQGANGVGAVLKLHQGNTWSSCGTQNAACNPTNNCCPTGTTTCILPVFPACWTGIFDQYIMVTDNRFSGPSGANLTEIAPQNTGADERIRYTVTERNLFRNFSGAQGGRMMLLSAVNSSFRDNAMNMSGTSALYPIYGVQIAARGVEPIASADEIYNNTGYTAASVSNPQYPVGFSNIGAGTAGQNSWAINNLDYNSSNNGGAVFNGGTGNTVTNNTATLTNNPGFTNGSTTFSLISDFKPTANFTGGVSEPVWYDALGVAWSPTWDLGAVHH